MKQNTFVVAVALAVQLALPALAQDPIAVTAPATVTITSGQSGTVVTQTAPVIRWREFQGEVTHVNVERRILEMKLKGTGEYLGVPIAENMVGIYKKDHQYALQDIRTGDDVTVRNLVLNF